jgi:tRNA(Ile)-lysidine synthase
VNPELVSAYRASTGTSDVVIALGGGADSAVLLATAAASASGKVRAVFVDHGLAASRELADAAAALAGSLHIPLSVLDGRVAEGPDLESRARDVRYRVIGDDLAEGELLVTAHTADDQAETVVMRLASGAGSAGLGGIPSVRGVVRRPFLSFTRSELRAIAEGTGLPFADDPGNADHRFTRSRIRHGVIPILEAELGPGVVEALARSAAILSEDDAALEARAAEVPILIEREAVRVPASALATTEPAVASRICRRALRIVHGGYPGTARDVAGILITAGTGATSQLGHSLLAIDDGSHVWVGRPPEPDPAVALGYGGDARWGGSSYTLVEDDGRPFLAGGRFTIVARGVASMGVEIRGAEDGDRIDVGIGTTPVMELLRSHRVPAIRRPVSPVVTRDGKIAAVIGVRTAAWAAPERDEPRAIIEREVQT